jgi:cation transport protein ChaC
MNEAGDVGLDFDATGDPACRDFWVFGYGSLMWRPGFDYLEAHPAKVFGVHRALCVYSISHRGTHQQPGLVLGLDRGGSCRGVAYKVAAALRDETLKYLQIRELRNRVYRESMRRIVFSGNNRSAVRGICYVVNRGHPQYAGSLDPDHQVELVIRGRGNSGDNPDYLFSTVHHLEQMGIYDPGLAGLSAQVRQKMSAAK